jgi:N-acetylglucosamine-6-phosphate deacetylase
MDASGGRVGIVTLAPELDGAIELIGRLAEAGVVCSLGHTRADNAAIADAVAAGAKLCTHLGNGSEQFLPRLDNYVQRLLAEDRLAATFIADGHHMPFTTLQNFLRAKTPGRSILITDAIVGAGLGPGEYPMGGGTAIVRADGFVSRPGENHLAGSVVTLDLCVLHAVRHCRIGFEDAWAMASTQPAALVGLATPAAVTVAIDENGFRTQ